jgi:hypothetical protein
VDQLKCISVSGSVRESIYIHVVSIDFAPCCKFGLEGQEQPSIPVDVRHYCQRDEGGFTPAAYCFVVSCHCVIRLRSVADVC